MPFLLLVLMVVFWYSSANEWHPALGIGYALALAAWMTVLLRRWRAERVQDSALPANQAGPIWRAGLSAKEFATRLTYFLRLQGWSAVTAEPTGPGHVEVATQRDRFNVVLLCVAPDVEPKREDIEHLAALLRDQTATHACLVTAKRAAGEARLGDHDVRLLVYADLDELVTILGLDW